MMSRGDLLDIQPAELKFPFELKKQISCSLQLTNKTDGYVAFKVKTKNPKNCCVRPNTGIVLPGTTCNVTVTMRAQKEAPKDMQCKDMFLIQSITASSGATGKDITPEMFEKESGKVVNEVKLRAFYVTANSLVPGSAPRASANPLLMSMSTGDLLNILPTELKFPFELKKQSSCSLQLTNKTDEYVAFKFKTTNPKNYIVRPNTGIVLPGATCDVTVTVQAQKEAPKDMQCKDKFLLQSFTAPNGATGKDITPEMFENESGNVVKEFKLRAFYVPIIPLVPGSAPRVSANPLLMSISTGDLLNIQPTELKFPFELKKQSSCSLLLTNKTDEYVAFKFKTTNPKNYIVRPNTGIVLPGATCDVTVTVQAQKEAPKDMQCKDKFLLQSFTALNGATGKDITPEMFENESGKVKEFKLRVFYVPVIPLVPGSAPRASANPLHMSMSTGDLLNIQPTELKFPFELKKQSSCSLQLTNKTDEYVAFKVPEESVEGSSLRASGVENGNQETSLFDAIKRPTKEKNILGKVIALLGKAKTKIESKFDLRNKEKAIMAGDVQSSNKEKFILASEKTQLETDIELLNKEKTKLQSDKDRLQMDIELLKKEKDILHQVLNKEKTGCICSVIHEANESINEREKTSAEDEKVVAGDTQELQEELIKLMKSENASRNEQEKTLSDILQADIELLKKEKDTLHIEF